MRKLLTLSLCTLFGAVSLFAQDKKEDEWKISAGVQIRTELDGRDFSNATYPSSFTSMRTRIGVEKTIANKLTLFAQFQDSRLWGEETSTTANMQLADLHQGYILINDVFNTPISLQAGRFEINYGNGKFISSSQWSYISRSWDGLKLTYKDKIFSADLFSLTHNKSHTYLGSADTSLYPYPAKKDAGFSYFGLWTKSQLAEAGTLDVFGLYENNRALTAKKNPKANRFTTGLTYNINFYGFNVYAEGAYQFGTAGDKTKNTDPKDISAYTAAATLSYTVSAFTFGVGADVLSGTKRADLAKGDETNTYDASFQGKHSFYGLMNYFSSIDKSTYNAGINDYYFKAEFKPKDSDFNCNLAVHGFMTNQDFLMYAGTVNEKKENFLGNELDFVAKYKILKGADLEWQTGLYMQSDAMKHIWDADRTDEYDNFKRADMSYWTALMIRVAL